MPFTSSNFDRQNLLVLGGCLAVLIIFIALWIVPAIYANKKLEATIRKADIQLQELKQLKELDAKINSALANFQAAKPPIAIAQQTPPATDAEEILAGLKETARTLNIEVKSMQPEIMNQTGTIQRIQITSSMRGRIDHLRNFLIRLLEHPCINEVINVELKATAADPDLYLVFMIEIG